MQLYRKGERADLQSAASNQPVTNLRYIYGICAPGAVGNVISEKCETMRPRKLSRSDKLTHFSSDDSPSSEKKPTPPRLSRLSVHELINWPLTDVRNRLPCTLIFTR